MLPVLLFAATVLVAALIWIVMAKRSRVAFKAEGRETPEEFPLLSDAEFLASCRPGTNPEVALKVRRIVAELFDIEYERVHPTMRFIDFA